MQCCILRAKLYKGASTRQSSVNIIISLPYKFVWMATQLVIVSALSESEVVVILSQLVEISTGKPACAGKTNS